jgi:hypothetical protein
MSFVDPCLLPPAPVGRLPAAHLAHVAAQLRLDFCFVSAGAPWFGEASSLLSSAGVAPFAVVDGIAARCIAVNGFEAFARCSVTDPSETAGDLSTATAELEADVERALGFGASAIVIADDLAGSGGPLLNPAFVAEEVLARLAACIDGLGVPAVLHCDGDARAFYRSAAGVGFAAVHGDCGGTANIYAAYQAARAAGLAFIGGIPSAALADRATAALAGVMAATMASAGGVLVSDDGGVSTKSEAAALIGALAAAAGE